MVFKRAGGHCSVAQTRYKQGGPVIKCGVNIETKFKGIFGLYSKQYKI